MSTRLTLAIICLTLAACRQIPAGGASPSDLAPVASTQAASTLTPSPIPPTATPSPAIVPTATLTTQQAIYPYTIEGLRAHDYQSGEVTVIGVIVETKDFVSYLIEYPSDGLNIRGVMQIPTRAAPPYPVIVMNHGYFARSVFRSGDGTDRAAEYLNTRGYLTIAPDYRSWGTSDSGPSLFYSGLAIDVVNLLKAIPSIPQADATRVGMWGHSMGGAVTMKVLAIVGDNPALKDVNVRAAVLYSTVSADQADVLERWGPGCYGDVVDGESQASCNSSDVIPLDLPPEIQIAYYRAAHDANALRLISPFYHLNYVTAPVQIHYGELDGEEFSGTPPEWSIKLFDAFLEAGKSVKLIAYEGERHSFVNEAWYSFMDSVAKFYNQTVKNIP